MAEQPTRRQDERMATDAPGTPGAPGGTRTRGGNGPPPNIVGISNEGLQQLIDQAVQNVLQQQRPQTFAAPLAAPQGPNSKGLKLADPKEFSGKPEDLQDFLINCEMVFAVCPDVYDTNEKKIVYALALMKTKNAALWKKQYALSNFRGAFTDTWNLFKDRLLHDFKDVGQAQNAMKTLGTMTQGKMAIEEFNMKFLIHGGKAGLDFGDTMAVTRGQQTFQIPNLHSATLIHLYQNALNPTLAQQITIQGEPDTISEWMSRAATIDSAYRRTNVLFARGINGQGRSNWKPRFQPRGEYRGEPMDIGFVDTDRPSQKDHGPRQVPLDERR